MMPMFDPELTAQVKPGDWLGVTDEHGRFVGRAKIDGQGKAVFIVPHAPGCSGECEPSCGGRMMVSLYRGDDGVHPLVRWLNPATLMPGDSLSVQF